MNPDDQNPVNPGGAPTGIPADPNSQPAGGAWTPPVDPGMGQPAGVNMPPSGGEQTPTATPEPMPSVQPMGTPAPETGGGDGSTGGGTPPTV